MGFPNLKIELDPRPDRNDNIFHIGRIQAPCSLRFKKGITFFVFLSEAESEELHIGCAKPGSPLSSVKRGLADTGTLDRVFVNLEQKSDAEGKPYYMAVVQDDTLEIDLEERGAIFMIFTSVPGKEQLQIIKNQQQQQMWDTNANNGRAPEGRAPEILHRNSRGYERKDSSTEFRVPVSRRLNQA